MLRIVMALQIGLGDDGERVQPTGFAGLFMQNPLGIVPGHDAVINQGAERGLQAGPVGAGAASNGSVHASTLPLLSASAYGAQSPRFSPVDALASACSGWNSAVVSGTVFPCLGIHSVPCFAQPRCCVCCCPQRVVDS